MLNAVAATSFWMASYLTDPLCKSHEFYRRMGIVEALHPEGYRIMNLVRKVVFAVGVVGCGFVGVFATGPGILLRAFGASIQSDPYIYEEGTAKCKELSEGRKFSLLSWNICCVGGGYSISDGGVLPWHFRIERIAEEVIRNSADVNCLYETFDIQSAFSLCSSLKKAGYSRFYYNIGPRAIGVSSGIFIASRYEIKRPKFLPFPEDALDGRAKHSSRGGFVFDLVSGDKRFAQIVSTHLQHSEEPAFPTEGERRAREKQMQLLSQEVDGGSVILTGDLNLDDAEYQSSSWHACFQKGDNFVERTWGGDAFCARLVGKRVSGALNLDHTMGARLRSLSTTLVKTGFDAERIQDGALSDHQGLLSEVEVF
ncbi:MAG: hypothetical protein JSS61_00065 [Verrucomicrobia bacterium]|nr:hypothetical protein [Verrucomicrobiota bacterium]